MSNAVQTRTEMVYTQRIPEYDGGEGQQFTQQWVLELDFETHTAWFEEFIQDGETYEGFDRAAFPDGLADQLDLIGLTLQWE